MKETPSALILTLTLFVGALRLGAGEPKGGGSWESLFDGTSLRGWQVMNDATAQVTNGVIRVGGGMGWLRSVETFKDFVLEVEWRGLEKNYNSGVFVRAATEGKPFPDGVWQVNLKASAVGALLNGSTVVLESKTPMQPVAGWCKFRIVAQGRTLTLFVNDTRAWQFDKLDAEEGSVGLQAEGKLMEFRNVRIKRLPGSGAVAQ